MGRTALPTLDEVLEGVGLTAIWEARGEVRGMAIGEVKGKEEIVRNMLGLPPSTTTYRVKKPLRHLFNRSARMCLKISLPLRVFSKNSI